MGKVISERPCGDLRRRDTGGGSGKYKLLYVLGKGGQGVTEVCRRNSDGKELVRKQQNMFSMYGNDPMEMFLFEKVLMTHPHVLNFDHANWNNQCGSVVLYFEHCEGGDLAKWQGKACSKLLEENFLWHVFIQLADALAYLHHGTCMSLPLSRPHMGWKRTIHRDMKPANIFLRQPIATSREIPDVVIGDFGLATFKEPTYGCGTDEWVAPETPKVTKEGDVWGLGAIIHALAHGIGPVGQPPAHIKGKQEVKDWYWSPKARNPKPMSKKYSSSLNRNMMDCLLWDPAQRVTSKELLATLKREMPRELRDYYGA